MKEIQARDDGGVYIFREDGPSVVITAGGYGFFVEAITKPGEMPKERADRKPKKPKTSAVKGLING